MLRRVLLIPAALALAVALPSPAGADSYVQFFDTSNIHIAQEWCHYQAPSPDTLEADTGSVTNLGSNTRQFWVRYLDDNGVIDSWGWHVLDPGEAFGWTDDATHYMPPRPVPDNPRVRIVSTLLDGSSSYGYTMDFWSVSPPYDSDRVNEIDGYLC